jgi:hypothetical protein
MGSLLAAHVDAASVSVQGSPITWVVWLIIFIFMVVDVSRSRATTGAKVGWIIFAFICSLVALIVWLVWGRRKAYQGNL